MSNNKKNMSTFAPTLVKTADTAQAPALTPEARRSTAYAKFMATPEGTPESDQAWEELLNATYSHAK